MTTPTVKGCSYPASIALFPWAVADTRDVSINSTTGLATCLAPTIGATSVS